jgi:hypothetical protein
MSQYNRAYLSLLHLFCPLFTYQKNVCGIKRNIQYERRDGPVSFPGRRWREAKMGDFNT